MKPATKKQIKNFRRDVCPKCNCYPRCENMDDHWFQVCPKMFNYQLGFRDGKYHYPYENYPMMEDSDE